MKVIITAATAAEWMPSVENINPQYKGKTKRMQVFFRQTGVGMLSTAVALTKMVLQEKPDLVLQVGIAGCFNTKMRLGKLLVVKEEILGDMGVNENNQWKDIFDLKLEKESQEPFQKRKLNNPFLAQYNLLKLPEVKAITINEISTNAQRIAQLKAKYHPVIESMEGAALHYVCKQNNTPFLQIRAVSNYVGERNKQNWKIQEAINQLNNAIITYTNHLYQMS